MFVEHVVACVDSSLMSIQAASKILFRMKKGSKQANKQTFTLHALKVCSCSSFHSCSLLHVHLYVTTMLVRSIFWVPFLTYVITSKVLLFTWTHKISTSNFHRVSYIAYAFVCMCPVFSVHVISMPNIFLNNVRFHFHSVTIRNWIWYYGRAKIGAISNVEWLNCTGHSNLSKCLNNNLLEFFFAHLHALRFQTYLINITHIYINARLAHFKYLF